MGAPAEPWRKVPPCCYDDETEQRVAKREDPSWSFVVQDALQPILDEASGVRCCASLGAQPHFEGCERTYGTKPSLCDYNGNGSQMRSPKPQCIYPVPGAQIANDDEDEAADDEHDDGDVQREHYIGQKLIWKRVVHTRCGDCELGPVSGGYAREAPSDSSWHKHNRDVAPGIDGNQGSRTAGAERRIDDKLIRIAGNVYRKITNCKSRARWPIETGKW